MLPNNSDSVRSLHFTSDQRKTRNQKGVSGRRAEEHTRALCQFTGVRACACARAFEHASRHGGGGGCLRRPEAN